MTLSELKKGLLSLIQTIYPETKYKYYGMDVSEGFERPSFFTQIKPVEMDPNNYNSRNNRVTFFINYMQEVVDEVDALEKIQQIRDMFGLAVKIGDRAVKVVSFDYDFIGTERNIPEISIDLEWMDRIEHNENLPLMESAEINQEVMED